MTDNLSDTWKKVANDLGLEIVTPYRLVLPDQTEILVDVLVKNFGAKHGMLLVDSFSKIRNHTSAIEDLGYGFSTLSPPSDQDKYDIRIFEEVLSDWGWAGLPDRKPSWLKVSSDDTE
ncbi:MAG: hypothetical protein HY243_00970 [Proteobacteria bacterium]|nr:hypothetical protein [Pseudomonadota bacterium]